MYTAFRGIAKVRHLNLLCRILHSILYTGFYDCAQKNASRTAPSKFPGTPLTAFPIREPLVVSIIPPEISKVGFKWSEIYKVIRLRGILTSLI